MGAMTSWPFLKYPWAVDLWRSHFDHRPDLTRELAILDSVFSAPWREGALATMPFKHRLPYHLVTKGGWARLLDLAAELLKSVGGREISPEIEVPMVGRLRAANLYLPTLCEIVLAPILRAMGEVTWQPQGRDHGADYLVEHASGTLVAEVKRVCTSERQERAIAERTRALMAEVASGEIRHIFTEREELTNLREDARRLYPHVRKAVKQMATSARLAGTSGFIGREARGRVLGLLLLDLDGNDSLRVLENRISQWMRRPWAASIDLVIFADYDSCANDEWSTVVQPVFARTRLAATVLAPALRRCQRGHFHVRTRPAAQPLAPSR